MPMPGYDVPGYYRITVPALEVAWPCPADPDRVWTVYNDDVLTKQEKSCHPDTAPEVPEGHSMYTKHTGVMFTDLIVPDDKIEFVEDTAHLVGI